MGGWLNVRGLRLGLGGTLRGYVGGREYVGGGGGGGGKLGQEGRGAGLLT